MRSIVTMKEKHKRKEKKQIRKERKKIVSIFLNGHTLLFKKKNVPSGPFIALFYILYVYVYSAFIPEKETK